jgi:hypothetical protein
MGRFEGWNISLGAPRSLALALVLASAALVISSPVHAEAQASPTQPVKHKAKHASTPATEVSKASKTPPGGCQPTPDQASIGIRALQTELMVAGLKCSAEQWNAFTAKFKATIKTDADRMQRLFSKSYGKSGPNQMNAFVTQLANDASQRSNGFSEADYCKQEDVLFKKVLAFTNQELERFSVGRSLTVPAPVALCTPDPADSPTSQATVAVTTTPAPAANTVSLKR